MSKQRYGRIINIASVSAMRGGGSVGNTLYGATKAGVAALTMGLARELGPDGITVNAIAPAIADTAMTHAALTEDARRKFWREFPWVVWLVCRMSPISPCSSFQIGPVLLPVR